MKRELDGLPCFLSKCLGHWTNGELGVNAAGCSETHKFGSIYYTEKNTGLGPSCGSEEHLLSAQ